VEENMADFIKFKQAVQERFTNISKDEKHLFLANIDKEKFWNLYLDSFPEGTNEIYREHREFDCSCCRQFIQHFGNIVIIDSNNETKNIWDIEDLEYPYNIVAKELKNYIDSKVIYNKFITINNKLGTANNKELLEDNSTISWDHFNLVLPNKFVSSNLRYSVEAIQGKHKENKQLLQRAMTELTVDAAETILELIAQKSLYKGIEYKISIEEFLKYKKLHVENDNWYWKNSIDNRVCRIRNSAIGTLLIDLSNNVDINEAVRKYEKNVVAPENYKRPKAIFTKKMVEKAEQQIKELGFEDSLQRKFATLDDITANNIIYINRDVEKVNTSIFDELKSEVTENPKKFDKVEEISITDFINDVLPKSKNIKVLLDSKHTNNLVSLIGPQNKDSKSMFKWDNNFCWSYNGNIADSSMKKLVKKFGGAVDGDFRYSIMWNDNNENNNDFDAHLKCPCGKTIAFNTYKKPCKMSNGGQLDVDIRRPYTQAPNGAVENITFPNKHTMDEGKYILSVHNYSHNGGKTGFTAELEVDGKIYEFSYNKELRNDQTVKVANVTLKNGEFIVEPLIESSCSSKDIWNIKTNNFVDVSTIMYSPNYWDNKTTGNKHYLFFLKDCKNPVRTRGFYNEFLNEELMSNKRLFEALGSKMSAEYSDNQLSGLGFSETKRNELVVKVEGNFNRILKIKF